MSLMTYMINDALIPGRCIEVNDISMMIDDDNDAKSASCALKLATISYIADGANAFLRI